MDGKEGRDGVGVRSVGWMDETLEGEARALSYNQDHYKNQ